MTFSNAFRITQQTQDFFVCLFRRFSVLFLSFLIYLFIFLLLYSFFSR
jgi:hypothetical protein